MNDCLHLVEDEVLRFTVRRSIKRLAAEHRASGSVVPALIHVAFDKDGGLRSAPSLGPLAGSGFDVDPPAQPGTLFVVATYAGGKPLDAVEVYQLTSSGGEARPS